MGLGITTAVGLAGIDGFVVEVEADVSAGLPRVVVSGRPDGACAQAPDRVRAAAGNAGCPLPLRRITVNLSPAAVPKVGAGYDLAIAVAVLAADGQIPAGRVQRVVHLGELALDGRVRPVLGVLPMLAAAARAGLRHAVVPVDNAAEARLVEGLQIHPVADLAELVQRYRLLDTGVEPPSVAEPPVATPVEPTSPDLADVIGQAQAREAVEIAAAGGHHLCLVGPPGAGKTMLAQRLPGLLPELDDRRSFEASRIASVLGALGNRPELVRRPPFVAPHHGASVAALIGGGGGAQIRPGAITAAHGGVLFLDEAPEFKLDVLQSLRQPIESGTVTIARALGRVTYPCRFQLVLAANPCPCGMAFGTGDRCSCNPLQRRRYLARLRGPLLDRVDLRVTVTAPRRAVAAGTEGEPTSVVAARVRAAREVQAQRWAALGLSTNAEVPGPRLRSSPWRLPASDTTELDRAMERGSLTMRGYDRVLRIAWTLADLRGGVRPERSDVLAAVTLRADDAVAA